MGRIIERKQAEEELTKKHNQLRSLVSRLTLAEEHERKKVAASLHDGAIQKLSIFKMKLGVLTKSVDSSNLSDSLDYMYENIGGAIDFLEKPFSDQVLLDSINKAIETSLKSHRHHAKIAEIQERMDSLTSRERQILDGIVEAKTNKMIALELQLSPKTVDFHRCNVMEKMGVNNTVQLVKMVMKVSGTQTSTRSK